MNEATKQFFAKLYLQQVTSDDYVDWAFACLEEGFDSKSLRLLAGTDKSHTIKADFEDLFRQSLVELDWKYLDKKESLFNYAKDIAKKILSNEIGSQEAVEKIQEIHFQQFGLRLLDCLKLIYHKIIYQMKNLFQNP